VEPLPPTALIAAVIGLKVLFLAPLTGEFVALARLLPAFGVTSVFALLAWGMRGVTARGAVAGFVCTFLIALAAGYGGFMTVLVVFALTLFATQFGQHRKLAAGIAETRSGRRGYQVLANVAGAAMIAVPAIFFPRVAPLLFAAMVGALCEAAADTVSSEVGKAVARRAHLITNLQSVVAGTDGGITLQGTLAGIIAAWMVAAVAAGLNVISQYWIFPAMLSGIAGMLLDSVLGAKLQRPGRLGNDSVNFVSTVFAACLVLGYGLLLMS
jgi:uncharacterized protein (TIGR00297 family)